MDISEKSWANYINALRKLSDTAASKFMEKYLSTELNEEGLKALVEYAYALATKYGEGAAALACEMYDALAILSGYAVPSALPANTATYGDAAKTVYGVNLQSKNPEVMSEAVARLVKLAGVDTMQQNALRDGAEWAWIPSGDTCAFCIMLASNGWQKASKKAIKNGHAEHVHANCDCTYAIRFSPNVNIEGYDPDKYYEMYSEAEGHSTNEKINYMRREFYAENKDEINAQKRDAYEKRQELNNSAAEETDVN